MIRTPLPLVPLAPLAIAALCCAPALSLADEAVTVVKLADHAEPMKNSWFWTLPTAVPQGNQIPLHLELSDSRKLVLVDVAHGKVLFEATHRTAFLHGSETVVYDQKLASTKDGRTLLKIPDKYWKLHQSADGLHFYACPPGTHASGDLHAYDAKRGTLLWKAPLQRASGLSYGLQPLPEGMVAVLGYRKLGQHKTETLVRIEQFNAKGKPAGVINLEAQAEASREPLLFIPYDLNGKSKPAIGIPDFENSDKERGLLIRFLKGDKKVFVPKSGAIIDWGAFGCTTLTRGRVSYGLVGVGPPEEFGRAITPIDLKRNRPTEAVTPGPLTCIHPTGLGRYQNELWDVIEGKKIADLRELALNEPEGLTLEHHVSWINGVGFVAQPLAGGEAEVAPVDALLVNVRTPDPPARCLGVRLLRDDEIHVGYFDPVSKKTTILKSYPRASAAALFGFFEHEDKWMFVVTFKQTPQGPSTSELLLIARP